jgi:uncharacterized protein (TIGR00369 family)
MDCADQAAGSIRVEIAYSPRGGEVMRLMLNLPEGANGTTTLESKTNFLGSAKEGETVLGHCTPVHIGRRTSVWQTKIVTEAGRNVALVTQTQMVL